ncbi:hypothetical protein K8O68_00230 [Salipaludibacillus sp. CUR1]|uniref:hypothetical protein n=1 Tax=Salipaludibacillus sp. CUR1 TaxID=2820003 RepID=UPI001E659876|nr:hypothetical protein [Salipaludibacillus sp. CUR1]MCE7790844.1 hypothetical protein [Salipaludibacillus sp. CUR1]
MAENKRNDGREILCIGISSPIDIVLFDIPLQIEIPLVRLSSSDTLSDDEWKQLSDELTGLLDALGNRGSTDG